MRSRRQEFPEKKPIPMSSVLAVIAAFSFVIGCITSSSGAMIVATVLVSIMVVIKLTSAALDYAGLNIKVPPGWGLRAWMEAATVRRPIP